MIPELVIDSDSCDNFVKIKYDMENRINMAVFLGQQGIGGNRLSVLQYIALGHG